LLLAIAIFVAIVWLPNAWGVALVAAAGLFELAEAGFFIWYSKRRKTVTGAEALPGQRGIVVATCRPDGQVRVDGELWQARCEEGADVGDEVVVEGLGPNLTLVVKKET
jgi:membrane-bound serine protease (ClpP class)